jgi:hypothetical protein
MKAIVSGLRGFPRGATVSAGDKMPAREGMQDRARGVHPCSRIGANPVFEAREDSDFRRSTSTRLRCLSPRCCCASSRGGEQARQPAPGW